MKSSKISFGSIFLTNNTREVYNNNTIIITNHTEVHTVLLVVMIDCQKLLYNYYHALALLRKTRVRTTSEDESRVSLLMGFNRVRYTQRW